LLAKWNQRPTAATGQETEVPDADKAARQHVQQKATQKLIDVQSQKSLLILVSGVAPAERHLVLGEGNEPVVGNRNAMGVGAEVTKHLIGAAERWFAVNHPVQPIKLVDQTSEQLGLRQAAKQSVELELSRSVSLLEGFQELAAEDFAEHPLGKKEAGIARVHPVCVIARQAAGGHDAVSVGMMLQLLIPGVQNAEEANLSAEALGVRGDFDQGLGAATEQQPVDRFFVLQGQRSQLVGERKHDMSVRRREQFGAPRGQPTVARLVLALGAVPVPARNGDLSITCLMGSIF